MAQTSFCNVCGLLYGNMTCTINGQTQGLCPTYSFSSANNQITNTGYTYDAAGDLTSDGTNTYQYDAEERRVSANGGSWAATYDVFGHLVQRYNGAAGETDSFLWDPSGNVIANWSQNHGWWWDEWERANGAIIADNRQDENTVWFLHPSLLGSTESVTNSAGQTIWESLYYPRVAQT